MKTILVLTDFSKTARVAANFASAIGCRLESALLLLNSYQLPFALFSAETEGRSIVDSALIATASESGLKKEARRLRRLIDKQTTTAFKPKVTTFASIESIAQILKNLNPSLQISMMVMGMHHTSLPLIFSAIDLEGLLKQLNYPLLIIPKNHKGTQIADFVFATDLGDDDLSFLRRIQPFAQKHKFNIHVCHIAKPVFIPDFIQEDKVTKFERNVAMLGRANITFTLLKGENMIKTLNEFNATIGADMLGIIYNPHSLLYKVLNGSHTTKLARHQKLPLLIFPANLLAKHHG
ncbi:hypothetical protein WG904_12635 [Pedobacter sp. Du54]|uniref:hypothetical protein n=1 Tax=Pedobacter anseongensis TaxID=3133439 RepID=UPI0030B1D63D